MRARLNRAVWLLSITFFFDAASAQSSSSGLSDAISDALLSESSRTGEISSANDYISPVISVFRNNSTFGNSISQSRFLTTTSEIRSVNCKNDISGQLALNSELLLSNGIQEDSVALYAELVVRFAAALDSQCKRMARIEDDSELLEVARARDEWQAKAIILEQAVLKAGDGEFSDRIELFMIELWELPE